MKQRWIKKLLKCNSHLSNKELVDVSLISGGCINQAWKLSLKGDKAFFVKIGSEKLLLAEAKALKELHKWADQSLLTIPQPLFIDRADSESLLLLPWLKFGNTEQSLLGQGLAMLHKKSAESNLGKFGWDTDAFIGSGPQPGGWETTWGKHFVMRRILPQMHIASKWGLNSNNFEKLLTRLISFLNEHKACPSIVHGDLWSGNAAMLQDGRGSIFDPATWWADRGVDIAMTKLFGGFSQSFYDAYNDIWPISLSDDLCEIYNLYHLLNHANLFGGSYKKQSIESLNQLNSRFNL